MAKKLIKRKTNTSKKPLIPRGVRPPRAGFRIDGSIMKNGGCKKK